MNIYMIIEKKVNICKWNIRIWRWILIWKKMELQRIWQNGNIIYELINGNGKVIEYNHLGYIEFEGEYLNRKKSGKGEFNGKHKVL